MQLIEQKLDYTDVIPVTDIYLFTGNSYITKDHRLVMGRGAALEVRDNVDAPVAEWMGSTIKHLSRYGIKIYSSAGIGAFQVKRHFKDKASLELIDYSAEVLKIIAQAMASTVFRMNYPGIGNGGLSMKSVEPLLEELPDNVLIYRMD